MTHYDIAPTLLHALGLLDHPQGAFGLGISLFAPMPEREYQEHLKQVTHPSITGYSITYESFWNTKTPRGDGEKNKGRPFVQKREQPA